MSLYQKALLELMKEARNSIRVWHMSDWKTRDGDRYDDAHRMASVIRGNQHVTDETERLW